MLCIGECTCEWDRDIGAPTLTDGASKVDLEKAKTRLLNAMTQCWSELRRCILTILTIND